MRQIPLLHFLYHLLRSYLLQRLSLLRDSNNKGNRVPADTFIASGPCFRIWSINGELASWDIICLLCLDYKVLGNGDHVLLVCSGLSLAREQHRDESGEHHLCAHIFLYPVSSVL